MARFALGTLEKMVLGYWAYKAGKRILTETGGMNFSGYSTAQAREITRVAGTSRYFVHVMDALRHGRGFTIEQTIEFIVAMPARDFFEIFEVWKPC